MVVHFKMCNRDTHDFCPYIMPGTHAIACIKSSCHLNQEIWHCHAPKWTILNIPCNFSDIWILHFAACFLSAILATPNANCPASLPQELLTRACLHWMFSSVNLKNIMNFIVYNDYDYMALELFHLISWGVECKQKMEPTKNQGGKRGRGGCWNEIWREDGREKGKIWEGVGEFFHSASPLRISIGIALSEVQTRYVKDLW